jgi:hypothetical protein
MKAVAQIFLVILFFVLFVSTVLTSTVKFTLLNYSFWSSAFGKHNVYNELSNVIKNSVDLQVGNQGGVKSDVSILTDLVTPENTRDFVNNNLTNFIDFLNGKSGELIVYVPINRAPKGLLPKNIADLNNEMTVTQLGEKFDIGGLNQLPFDSLSRVGITVLYALIGSAVLLLIFLSLLIVTTEGGSRFIAAGTALILSGGFLLAVSQWGSIAMDGVKKSLAGNTDLGSQILATVSPALTAEIMNFWMYAGIAAAVMGVISIFIKKADR